MASLRFRDLLRARLQSLSIQGHILKEIHGVQTFSIGPTMASLLGISTRPSQEQWPFRFLQVVQSGIEPSQYWNRQWSPDFLLPSWTDSIPFSSPCSYHHALALIRYCAQCNWLHEPLLTPDPGRCLSTHSMKSTLLAAAGQLNLNIAQRAKQGHRKQSVQLYPRDDVWPSLFPSA